MLHVTNALERNVVVVDLLIEMFRKDWICTNILIIRHGQSANNTTYSIVEEKFGSSISPERYEIEIAKLHNPDPNLSPVGEQQSQLLAESFRNGQWGHVLASAKEWHLYSSPMKRCLDTTFTVSKGFAENIKVTVHPLFFESDGCFRVVEKEDGSLDTEGVSGFTKSYIESTYPNFFCLPGMDDGWYKLPKMEIEAEFKRRAEKCVEYLWELHSARTAEGKSADDQQQESDGYIFVAHGNLLRAVVSMLIGTYALISSDNTGVTHVQLWSERLNPKRRIASVQFVNRVDHLLKDTSLITGSDMFKDHWIQEITF